jgi:hypothetical protein
MSRPSGICLDAQAKPGELDDGGRLTRGVSLPESSQHAVTTLLVATLPTRQIC